MGFGASDLLASPFEAVGHVMATLNEYGKSIKSLDVALAIGAPYASLVLIVKQPYVMAPSERPTR